MFLGHIGVALAAKRAAPRTSLGTLVAASIWIDLVWPVLLLAGVERVRIDPGNTAVTPLDFEHYPWTHGGVAVLLWSLAFGAAVLARTGYRRGAVVAGALVASHWVLDAIVHRPDLPLAWDGTKVGLGLWNDVPATFAVELGLLAAGLVVYVRAAPARDATGRRALAALAAFLVAVYLANVLGPPPPSVKAVAVGGLAQWLLVAWAAWIDRHRGAPAPGLLLQG
ncbi:MAG TPA: hypothetical protein VF841_01895 [Anaeromyxobacter sp.]